MAIVRLEPNGPRGEGLTEWGAIREKEEGVVDGEPIEHGHNFFTDASGQLTAGVWECTPYTQEIDAYPVNEYCHILSGKVVITDADSASQTFQPGDSFVIAKGTRCTWHMPETTRKFYVIFDDRSG